MIGANLQVVQDFVDWRQSGHDAVLITVLATWGSSPRPPGSIAAIRRDGRVSGSVSGGCVEGDLLEKAASLCDTKLPQLMTYGVSKDEAERFGLPCGGVLQLCVEPRPDVALLQTVLGKSRAGEIVCRRVHFASGHSELRPMTNEEAVFRRTADWMDMPFGPQWRLLIIGANQIAAYLTPLAQSLDFKVMVCDPRESYAAQWSLTTCLREMPDDVVRQAKLDARSAIVAVTHDPVHDDLALIAALESPAFYVGALGARNNQAKRKKRLIEHFAIAPTILDRLRGPVGLPIGSRTPPEIAISIAAELIAERAMLSSCAGLPNPALCTTER